jgi:hypothetical protein
MAQTDTPAAHTKVMVTTGTLLSTASKPDRQNRTPPYYISSVSMSILIKAAGLDVCAEGLPHFPFVGRDQLIDAVPA